MKQKLMNKLLILFICEYCICFLLSDLMTSIYILEINLYIKESTLSIIFFVFSLILYGFINITTCTENLLIKVILIHLPILLLFLLKLLSTHFMIGISILFLSISIWLIYIFVYLKLNRNKNIQINSLFMKSLLILVLVLLLVFPSSLFSSTSSKELRNSFEDNKPLIQQNKNELNILDYKKWYQSSEIEKLHCLQIIVNIESNISGISDIPKVKFVDLHKTIKGRFINQNNIIQINKQYLNKEDCNEIVSTVLHEFRHKYQFKIIESCDFEKKDVAILDFYLYPRMVNKALKEYPIDTSKEKESYYYNFIEMDARQFAQNTLKEYNKKIPNMINPNV